MSRRTVVTLAAAALAASLIPLGAGSAGATDPTPVAVPPLDNVFVIVGENTSLSQLDAKDAPYELGTVRTHSAWFSDYWGISHYSTSNYVAMTSGQFLPCHQADEKPATCNQDVPNLFGELTSARISWKAWNESMPGGCYLVNSGENRFGNSYRVKHNPAAYYEDIVGPDFSGTRGNTFCRNHVVSMGGTTPNDKSRFETDLATGSVPRFNYVVPNMCEDGHDNCKPTGNPILQFDSFLAREIPKIEASPAWTTNSVIVVVYDEGQDGGPGKAVKFAGGNVPFAVIGKTLVDNGTYGQTMNHYNLLRTLEEGFGLPSHAGAAADVPNLGDIWN
ncbi:MAG: alkaline phosphatase family protein [Actinomycetes bacterium]